MCHESEGQPDIASLTLGMAVAGGQEVQACLDDHRLLAKGNAPGEIAARVFYAMMRAAPPVTSKERQSQQQA